MPAVVPTPPLETPYGLSLTSLTPGHEGEVLWSTEIENIHSLLNSHWNADHTYAFSGEYHLVLDTESGRELSRRSVRENVKRWQYDETSKTWNLKVGVDLGKRPRLATYHTNIVAGDWHYFLSHQLNAVGRVNTRTQEVEHLDVPVQLAVSSDGTRKEIWDPTQSIPNLPINSRGIDLTKDKRSTGTGWGHNSAASPILVGRYLYFPVMSGTVYVIDTEALEFSEKAIVALNDLGPTGSTWTLSGLSYAEGKLYARTIKEVICIQEMQ